MIISKSDGLTILGGGRYDGLVEELGGQKTPAIGFGSGEERLLDLFEASNPELNLEKNPDLFVAYIGNESNVYATKLVSSLREKGIYVLKDIMGRSLGAQFKYANKKKAKYVITIGDNEIKTGIVELKEMQSGETKQIKIDDIENELK